jgi:hypothetical protein
VEHDDRLLHGDRLAVHDHFPLLGLLRGVGLLLRFELLRLLLLGDRLDNARRRCDPRRRALDSFRTLESLGAPGLLVLPSGVG